MAQIDDLSKRAEVGNLNQLPPSSQKTIRAIQQQNRISKRTSPLVNPAVDLVWSKANNRTAANSYVDYYFSGQDIKVYVDGVENDSNSEIPIISFAYNIQQQKTPLYGFWSYTYDHMLKGTRIVTGQFSIATKTTDYMYNLLSAAATARLQTAQSHQLAPLTADEQNIQKYWHADLDQSPGAATRNMFSSHPTFDFIVVFGLQSVSINEDASQHNKDLVQKYQGDNLPLYTDTNERLVSSDSDIMRYIMQDVEITSLQVEFSPDGSVCAETYSFLARDMYLPQ